MKVIDLKKRTIYVDDIEQIYCETNYSPERYNIQTTYGTYLVDQEDYFKVKNYLLSLNDKVEVIEEDKKIEKLEIEPLNIKDDLQRQIELVHYENVMIANAVNEIIDKVNKGE